MIDVFIKARAAGVTLLPGVSVPVFERDPGCGGGEALPPHSSVAGLAHVGEHGVFDDGGHGVRVGLFRGAGSHAEETVLWVDGPQFPCGETHE